MSGVRLSYGRARANPREKKNRLCWFVSVVVARVCVGGGGTARVVTCVSPSRTIIVHGRRAKVCVGGGARALAVAVAGQRERNWPAGIDSELFDLAGRTWYNGGVGIPMLTRDVRLSYTHYPKGNHVPTSNRHHRYRDSARCISNTRHHISNTERTPSTRSWRIPQGLAYR